MAYMGDKKNFGILSNEIRDIERKVAELEESDLGGIQEIREIYGERIKEIDQWMELIKINKSLEIEADHLSRSLPARDTVEKILRYESAIERQLYRAINELERLQRRRRGEMVPPTINVEVSKE